MVPPPFVRPRRAAADAQRQGRPRALPAPAAAAGSRPPSYVAPRDRDRGARSPRSGAEVLRLDRVGVARQLLRPRRPLAAGPAHRSCGPTTRALSLEPNSIFRYQTIAELAQGRVLRAIRREAARVDRAAGWTGQARATDRRAARCLGHLPAEPRGLRRLRPVDRTAAAGGPRRRGPARGGAAPGPAPRGAADHVRCDRRPPGRAPDVDVALPVVDVSDRPASRSARSGSPRSWTRELTIHYDLVSGPLFRATLIRSAAEEHTLVLSAHHLVCDGTSFGVMQRDLGIIYSALVHGRIRAARAATQYSEYVAWRADQARHRSPTGSGCTPSRRCQLDLPADRARPPVQSFEYGTDRSPSDAELFAAVKAAGRRARA